MFYLERFNPGKGWGEIRDFLNELMKITIFAFRIDQDTLFIVEDPSSNRMGSSQIIDKWPEANSLNDSVDFDLRPFHIHNLTLF
jgi:hypothetical protein